MITLKYKPLRPVDYDSGTGVTKIEMAIDEDASRDQCLLAIKQFMLACGYHFNTDELEDV